jgi:hypothetical protein
VRHQKNAPRIDSTREEHGRPLEPLRWHESRCAGPRAAALAREPLRWHESNSCSLVLLSCSLVLSLEFV